MKHKFCKFKEKLMHNIVHISLSNNDIYILFRLIVSSDHLFMPHILGKIPKNTLCTATIAEYTHIC